MPRPKIMLLDEPSMGLAPLLVEEIFEIVPRMTRDEKVALLFAEQNAAMAPYFAKYAYVMQTARWRSMPKRKSFPARGICGNSSSL